MEVLILKEMEETDDPWGTPPPRVVCVRADSKEVSASQPVKADSKGLKSQWRVTSGEWPVEEASDRLGFGPSGRPRRRWQVESK